MTTVAEAARELVARLRAEALEAICASDALEAARVADATRDRCAGEVPEAIRAAEVERAPRVGLDPPAPPGPGGPRASISPVVVGLHAAPRLCCC